MGLYWFRGLFVWEPCVANGDKRIFPERGLEQKLHFSAQTPSRVELSFISLLIAQPAQKHYPTAWSCHSHGWQRLLLCSTLFQFPVCLCKNQGGGLIIVLVSPKGLWRIRSEGNKVKVKCWGSEVMLRLFDSTCLRCFCVFRVSVTIPYTCDWIMFLLLTFQYLTECFESIHPRECLVMLYRILND